MDRLVIKKYPNRRYYDTSRSTHVTLEEIYRMICRGSDISVQDSRSGEDITTKVLAQIILEHDPPKMDIFPVELLHRVIRSNEKAIEDFVENYLTQAFQFFCHSQNQFQNYLRTSMGLSAPFAGPTVGTGGLNPLLAGFGAMPGAWPMDFWAQKTVPQAGELPAGGGEEGSLTHLREKLEELQQENRKLRSRLQEVAVAGEEMG